MQRVTGTISDGDRVIAHDVPIVLRDERPRGDDAGWQGQFELPRDAPPLQMQRFYRLQTSDGRTGQIIFVGTPGTEGHAPTRLCFRTSGPFD